MLPFATWQVLIPQFVCQKCSRLGNSGYQTIEVETNVVKTTTLQSVLNKKRSHGVLRRL